MSAHILLVDDNEDFLDSTRDVLADEGYQVVAVSSGEQALDKLKSNPFDVILMDIRMPKLNGVETFIRMKKNSPNIRVIFFTAYSKSELIHQARAAGAYAIFYKPLNLVEVLETIKKASHEDSGVCILLADDDQAFCDSLCDSLSREGYTIEVALNSEDAVTRANEKSYDILLLDMKLPPQNGLEAYRRIRPKQPDLPVIIISGYTEEMGELIQQAITEKAYTCIPKPVNMNRLLALVSEISKKMERSISH